MTALALPMPQRGRADAAMLGSQPLVKVKQLSWFVGGDFRAFLTDLGLFG